MAETLTWRGDEFVTDLTDAVAATACERIPVGHKSYDYGRSLAADFRRYGSLFPGKRYWLHVLASEQVAREQPQPAPGAVPANAAGFLPNIAAFLTPASKKLKSGARVTFESGPLTVSISRVSSRGKWAGHFYVNGLTGFGADANGSIYAGRISPEGHWFPAPACEVAINALLDEFEQNPAQYAAAYGQRTGKCFACNAKLDDPISIGLGVGPVCSKHYGMPWGKRALAAALAMRCAKPVEAVA